MTSFDIPKPSSMKYSIFHMHMIHFRIDISKGKQENETNKSGELDAIKKFVKHHQMKKKKKKKKKRGKRKGPHPDLSTT